MKFPILSQWGWADYIMALLTIVLIMAVVVGIFIGILEERCSRVTQLTPGCPPNILSGDVT